jgi:hypothetical protein
VHGCLTVSLAPEEIGTRSARACVWPCRVTLGRILVSLASPLDGHQDVHCRRLVGWVRWADRLICSSPVSRRRWAAQPGLSVT